jgi:hypothetical protein
MPWPRIGRVSGTAAILTHLTLWFHGFWVFGVEMDYLNGGMQPMAPTLPVTTLFFAELALVPALLTAVVLALALSLTRHRSISIQRAITLPLWLILWFIAANAIAAQFAVDFGTTWQFMEPFRALMAHAILTPACVIAGLASLWFALR